MKYFEWRMKIFTKYLILSVNPNMSCSEEILRVSFKQSIIWSPNVLTRGNNQNKWSIDLFTFAQKVQSEGEDPDRFLIFVRTGIFAQNSVKEATLEKTYFWIFHRGVVGCTLFWPIIWRAACCLSFWDTP